MNICVIGTGYVGLVVGACFAETGNQVICVDNDEEKIKDLNSGVISIYEPQLDELVRTNTKEGRLKFSDNIDEAIKNSLVCFIAVGTPEDEFGNANLNYVYNVAEQIASSLNGYKVIVNKSTVPIGTGEKIYNFIKSKTDVDFDIVSNPEFLKQGAAVEDFLKPDRVVIGSNSCRATNIMRELYAPHILNGNPIMVMDLKSAEMTKYAANCFLALKISYINEIANICEKTGADINEVRSAISQDKRIGHHFMFAGIGFGGSCFPKDLKALINTAMQNDADSQILKAAYETNLKQRELFVQKIKKRFLNIQELTFGVWGLSFKPKTNDMRQAPSVTIIKKLLENGAKIKVFDPKAQLEAKKIFGEQIEYCKNSYEAIENADAMLLLTEWHEFRTPDFEKMSKMMKQKIIFDGRNQYNPKILDELGFEYYSIGR